MAVLDGVRVVLVVPDGVQLLFFPLDGIFSLGKYRVIYYYFAMRENIIIILLERENEMLSYYFI